jgi:hypothetical protein
MSYEKKRSLLTRKCLWQLLEVKSRRLLLILKMLQVSSKCSTSNFRTKAIPHKSANKTKLMFIIPTTTIKLLTSLLKTEATVELQLPLLKRTNNLT